jgi:alkylated DNA repair dioxygenase AlkB
MKELKLIAAGGILEFDKDFISVKESEELFTFLKDNVAWEHKHYIDRKTGQSYPQPRLTAWFADNTNMAYSYSGVTQIVQPWLPCLLDLKTKIENTTGAKYNSVLLNYYRNGMDSVGFHSDNEKELGNNPNIASVSLGETRTFMLQQYRTLESNGSFRPCTEGYEEYELTSGSLLVMSGTTQHFWKHSIPKTSRSEPRINLTYRYFHT